MIGVCQVADKGPTIVMNTNSDTQVLNTTHIGYVGMANTKYYNYKCVNLIYIHN